jgi:hypothetical protein
MKILGMNVVISRKTYLRLIILIICIVIIRPAYCFQGHTKLWTVAAITESFKNNKKVKYYFEPQLRLIDDKYVFNQLFGLVGWGYQVTPDLLLLAGPGWILIKNTQGQVSHEYRIWEQATWNMLPGSSVSLISRTRLEEQTRDTNHQLSVVLRERVFARIPIKHWDNHFISTFDEMFFNINRVSWAPQHFFAQNRAFLGLGIQLSNTTIVDVGYLNQYQRTNPIQMSNVFWLSLTINA